MGYFHLKAPLQIMFDQDADGRPGSCKRDKGNLILFLLPDLVCDALNRICRLWGVQSQSLKERIQILLCWFIL